MNDESEYKNGRRKESRAFCFARLKFVADIKAHKILNGVIVNRSDSGMEIFSYIPLSENQKVTIISPPYLSQKTFIVKWIRKYLDDFFMIGLKSDT